MDRSLLSALNEERRNRRAALVLTDMTSGAQRLIRGADVDAERDADELHRILLSGKSRMQAQDNGERFIEVHLPAVRFVIIGAVHISQALAPMAAATGFDVTVIDPRTAFATPERFAGVNLVAEWPDEVLADAPLDRWCALAALTHDPKIDDGPLAAALKAQCFYVGALGSRKTHGKRLDRLREAGLDDAALGRIQAPIGLDIGAQSPSEIAVAVLGEVIAALRGKDVRREAKV
ncbi:XdhC family protein [Tepidamorphus sp. 3E244]|uniref:XdhC family protein n=1 Tax=Tepidamorphus sp. 3E244 TaxID=3385498 RepID=UPI0038FD2A2B